MLSMILAAIRQRCPRCRKGPVFHGLMSMYDDCPVCGLVYRREYGYFYGAMYASYFFGLVTTAYWIPMLMMGVHWGWVIGLPIAQLVIQIPVTFRYSRVIWLYIDHTFDPLIVDEPAAGEQRTGAAPR